MVSIGLGGIGLSIAVIRGTQDASLDAGGAFGIGVSVPFIMVAATALLQGETPNEMKAASVQVRCR